MPETIQAYLKAVEEQIRWRRARPVVSLELRRHLEDQRDAFAAEGREDAERRMEALKRFDCEGTIYHVNRSCKVMDCQMMEVQRQLSELAGVPFTAFDGDQADYRNYSEAQFETRIQGLVELMKTNKEAKSGV